MLAAALGTPSKEDAFLKGKVSDSWEIMTLKMMACNAGIVGNCAKRQAAVYSHRSIRKPLYQKQNMCQIWPYRSIGRLLLVICEIVLKARVASWVSLYHDLFNWERFYPDCQHGNRFRYHPSAVAHQAPNRKRVATVACRPLPGTPTTQSVPSLVIRRTSGSSHATPHHFACLEDHIRKPAVVRRVARSRWRLGAPV